MFSTLNQSQNGGGVYAGPETTASFIAHNFGRCQSSARLHRLEHRQTFLPLFFVQNDARRII